MSLTPYQQSIWLVMCARNISHAGVAFFMIAVLALMEVRFIDHQIVVGLVSAAGLFFLSDRIIMHIPEPEEIGERSGGD